MLHTILYWFLDQARAAGRETAQHRTSLWIRHLGSARANFLVLKTVTYVVNTAED